MSNGDSNNTKSAASSSIPEDIAGNADESIEINGQATLKHSLTEVDIEKQKLMNDYREELSKIQEDIATLRLVLNDKLKRENELKQLLGVSFVEEIKQDFAEGINSLKSSTAYQKAAQTLSGIGSSVAQNETLKTATQKITPTFSTLGGTMKNTLGSLKNSSMYKSFEAGFGLNPNRMKTSQSEFQVERENQNS